MFEWNEKKRIKNLEDRNLDFENAIHGFNFPEKIILASPVSEENRWVDVAEVDGRVLVLVYTKRQNKIG